MDVWASDTLHGAGEHAGSEEPDGTGAGRGDWQAWPRARPDLCGPNGQRRLVCLWRYPWSLCSLCSLCSLSLSRLALFEEELERGTKQTGVKEPLFPMQHPHSATDKRGPTNSHNRKKKKKTPKGTRKFYCTWNVTRRAEGEKKKKTKHFVFCQCAL